MTTRLRSRLRRQDGFTMAAVMMGMLVLMGLTAAAFGAANGDIRLGQRSVDEKKAFSAAEAGTAYYLQKLAQDNDYWTKCTDDPEAPTPNPVNQMWDGTGADPRGWRALPTSPGQEYAVELLPRPGRTACVPADNESMIDPEQGTLRIRSTGRSNGVYRSVVSTLRRNGFLDFIYFTDRETSDPAQQFLSQPSFDFEGKRWWRDVPIKRLTPAEARLPVNATNYTTIETWADEPQTCGQWWRPTDAGRLGRSSPQGTFGSDGRGSAFYDPDGGGPQTQDWNAATWFNQFGLNIRCSLIQFRGPDRIDGPFHTNDHICVTNNPSFGRPGKGDRIEFYGFHPSCQQSANFNSTPKTGADLATIGVPKSNTGLRQTTSAPYRFQGKTDIKLINNRMLVRKADGSVSNLALPANGLVYVSNDPTRACQKFDLTRPYPSAGEDQGCGDALVSGTYSKSLTIATERDILITGDITAGNRSDALLGLIGTNYVRVKHTMESQPCDANTNEASGGSGDRRVEAAILSLAHVFTVDNYQCGDPLGDLEVFGAIAQLYRGPVGTSSGGSAVTGYTKVYQYDDRLRFRSPPYFMTPVESAWRVLRTTEQSAATRPAR